MCVRLYEIYLWLLITIEVLSLKLRTSKNVKNFSLPPPVPPPFLVAGHHMCRLYPSPSFFPSHEPNYLHHSLCRVNPTQKR
jgi:hypothetical protein